MKKISFAFLMLVLVIFSIAFRADAQNALSSALCPVFGQSMVSVALRPFPPKVLPGASLPVIVRVSNLKDYPLSGGMLVTRLVTRTNIIFNRSVSLNDMFIGPGASKEFSFSFDVPPRLLSGDYIVEATYAPSESGLTDVDANSPIDKTNAGSAPLTIESPFMGGFAYIDAKTASTSEAVDGSIIVSVDVVNPNQEEMSVPLVWKVNYDSTVSEKTAVSSVTETVKVPAIGRVRTSYAITDADYSSYEVIAEAVSNGMRSFASMRAEDVRGGASVRLLGIAPQGAGHQAFACVTNAFTDDPERRTVSLSVTDGSGTTLASGTFSVATTTNAMEFLLPFELRGSGDAVVAAVVSESGAKQYFEKTFPCTDLGTCSVPMLTALGRGLPIFGITMLAAGLGGLMVLLWFRKKGRRIEVHTP